MTQRFTALRRTALAAGLLAFAAAGRVSAQTSQADSRWNVFLGCWRNAPDGVTGAPLVCVMPTNSPSAVEFTTIANGAVVTRDTIDASGARHQIDKQGCTGWQNAEWSKDNRRLYLHADLTCTGGAHRTGSGIYAIAPTGEWLEIQGMKVGGNDGVRVTHYRDASTTVGTLPAGIADVNAGRQLAVTTARAAAGGALSVPDIAEAVKQVDTAVTQAWIVERGARFKLDASELLALTNAGVPGSVTDVMIGVSYPDRFALQQRRSSVMLASDAMSPLDSARFVSEYLNERCFGAFDPLIPSAGGYDPCGYRSSYRGYGFGYGYGYGYLPYGAYGSYGFAPGYYSGYGGYYSAPIIIVKGDQQQQQHGRVVNGRGYSQGSSGSTGGSSTGPSTSTTSSGAAAGAGGGSSGSSGGGDRTAHARPPV